MYPVNIQELRQSIKNKWLNYYVENRQWLTRLRVWVNCGGQHRPSSSFILATLSTLDPQLNEMLPLIVDLSSHPDRIVMALGLNFNPEEQLKTIIPFYSEALNERGNSEPQDDGSVKLLPVSGNVVYPPAHLSAAIATESPPLPNKPFNLSPITDLPLSKKPVSPPSVMPPPVSTPTTQPAERSVISEPAADRGIRSVTQMDETCQGGRGDRELPSD